MHIQHTHHIMIKRICIFKVATQVLHTYITTHTSTYNTHIQYAHTHTTHTHTHTHTHNNEPQDDITCSGSPGSRHSAAHKTACLSFKASHSIFFVISVALPPAPATRGLCANAASSTGDCPRRRHVCSNTASSGLGASFSHLSSAMRLRACSVCGKRQE